MKHVKAAWMLFLPATVQVPPLQLQVVLNCLPQPPATAQPLHLYHQIPQHKH